jgi:hypothetical protein
MSSGKTIREIPGSSVTQITKRREDSVMNGLLIGLAVGAGAGVATTASTCQNDSECSAIATAVFLPTFAGGGAGIGALLDALTHKHDPIYLQSAASDRFRLRLSPIASKQTKGIRLSMSF